ncbi:hypothetical protein LD11_gp139 [Bacillus phage Riley]|uniref:Uncharacterized protein n=3 Tax=Bequatrovirus TaxID=1917990 RepID=A0A075M0E5_9CAUD|nr:hypothetical protein LD11_gp139 [Bacillus phage Riley]YP_009206499.1 hypothetical protein AVV02_gp144 [Bacillus phage AvesoBmore]ASZ75871.1 hypothetical protein TAFFO16_138 [Bacillus phage Taffo16]ULF48764.1 hypothetical protein [Bacillus phage BillyBob]AIF72015.1 hypothetical protein [Bacillus phage Riley]ALA13530.1 hypothetical protein AVESOBMORE_144 [Bacillus phage AvesoBmore]
MKKVSINLTLEDNELFEKSIKDALISQAKQISREEIDKALTYEINRVATARVNELKNGGYWNYTQTEITKNIAKRLEKEITIDRDALTALLEEKVNKYLDEKIHLFGGIDKYVQNYINNAIADLLTNKR